MKRTPIKYPKGWTARQIKELEDAAQTIYFALVKGQPLKEMIVEQMTTGRPDLVPASIQIGRAHV